MPIWGVGGMLYICWTMKKVRFTSSSLLMVSSLVLLGGFIAWFLANAWRDQVANFKTEVSFLMVKAVRDIEGETINQLIFKSKKDSTSNDLETALPHPDSIKTIMIQNQERFIWNDSLRDSVKTRVNTIDIRLNNEPNNLKGSLSLILDMPQVPENNIIVIQDTNQLRQRLTAGLEKGFEEKGLGIKYLVEVKNNNDPSSDKAITSYTDFGNKNRYDVNIDDYFWYILKKIVPEILFCLFLFGVVSLSFYQINHNLKKQQRLTDIKNEFIRNITHELKTPIATVGVAIEALQHFGVANNPERTREYLDISQTELSRLSLLVDRVLKMSLFEEKEHLLQKEPVDLKLLVEEVTRTMRLQFEKCQAQVQLHLTDGAYTLQGDRMHLTNVLYNLLDNALKYSPNSPKIDVFLETSADTYTLRIQDNGIGIPALYQQKVFEKFFRVPTGDVHNVKGHGLGLSYVAGVISQHHGKVKINSTVGDGTEVVVVFAR